MLNKYLILLCRHLFHEKDGVIKRKDLSFIGIKSVDSGIILSRLTETLELIFGSASGVGVIPKSEMRLLPTAQFHLLCVKKMRQIEKGLEKREFTTNHL